MKNRRIVPYIDRIWNRALPEGGFAEQIGGNYRPDATAWAILAFTAVDIHDEHLELSRARLAAGQLDDGRICVSTGYPEVYWPTPLAIMAWQGSNLQRESQSRAVRFLINTSGKHWKKKDESPMAHDPGIPGWSWVADTHSWVEPTALSLIALQVAGYGGHQRAKEAAHLLMDRQLNHGGWNYGNTAVFDHELRPMPENTGLALNALAGRVDEESITHSLKYLVSQIKYLRTPLSLGWSLMGLGAWGKRPENAEKYILESLELQKRYGNYDTSLLGLLIASFFSNGGLNSIFT